MNQSDAKDILLRLERIGLELVECVDVANRGMSKEEAETYVDAIGELIMRIDSKLRKPVFQHHPELEVEEALPQDVIDQIRMISEQVRQTLLISGEQ